MAKNIIAVVGMCGSGKSEVVNYIQKQFKWPKYYFGTSTFERMKKEGLKLNYENERSTRELIRQELGMGAYAILALPTIKTTLKNNDNLVLESLYSWDEYKILKKEYGDTFKVIAVHASPEIRFKRLSNRDNERPIKDIEIFIKRDYTEIEGTDKGGPIARADFMIVNENGIDNLHQKINIIMTKININ